MITKRTTRRPAWPVAMALALPLVLLLATAAPPLFAAENVRLPGLRGGELTSADLGRGSTVVVVWASWSPRCRDIVERINALEARLGGAARVVAVDFQEEPAVVEQFLEGKKLGAPVFLDRDGEFAKSMEVTSLPGVVVFKDGAVRVKGRLPGDPNAVVEALR
ncbi:MAG: TlpA family protein disulfide reductase [Candidatus Binatia bacterium]